MRMEIEHKLQSMPKEQMLMIFGKNFTDKIRMIGKFIRQFEDESSERARQNLTNANWFEMLGSGDMDKYEVITSLRSRAEVVEYNLPLLMFKTNDEILQMKRYISVYYEPLLSKTEKMGLQRELPEFKPMKTSREIEDDMVALSAQRRLK